MLQKHSWGESLEGKQNILPQNMLLWHMDYFELVIFKKQQRKQNLWKRSGSYLLIRYIYLYKGNLHL